MLIQRISYPLIASLSLILAACSGNYNTKVNYNPSESIRVAVLPFALVDNHGEIVEANAQGLLIDQFTLLSDELEEKPTDILRKIVLAELPKTGLDLLSPALIDIDLPHHGFAHTDGSLDLKKIFSTSPQELCTKFLDCDAVLYGKVTAWKRSYYGLQTINRAGLSLSLIAARDGRELFTSIGEDSESRGLSKGPTGISDLIIEPVLGLNSELIVGLSRKMVRTMLEPLYIENRPTYLQKSPPSIYGTSHDAVKGSISRTAPLIVVSFGSPRLSSTFSIGKVIQNVPMIERAPGHYYGEYYPLPTDSFKNQEVFVMLTDEFGRTTTQIVSRDPVSLR